MEYELRHVAKATDLTPRRLRGWLEGKHPIREVLRKPRRGRGPGQRLTYTIDEILRLAIMAEFTRAFGTHLRPGFLARCLWKMPLHLLWAKSVAFFADGGKVIFEYHTDQETRYSSCGIIDMDMIRHQVLEGLKD